jgi:hypothetical protein
MNKEILIKKELSLLKKEISALKECQTRYVVLTITAVGLLFAYIIPGLIDANKCNYLNHIINFTCLVPLIIILPLSCIFFNKATTLFRIVGYYQILENFIINENMDNYIG